MKGFYREDIGKTEDKGKVKATSTKKKKRGHGSAIVKEEGGEHISFI